MTQSTKWRLQEKLFTHKVKPSTACLLVEAKSSQWLSQRCVLVERLQIKDCVTLFYVQLQAICILRVKERAGGGNKLRPSSLSGIDCLYKSREMRRIWPPLDWLESLSDRFIICEGAYGQSVFVRHIDRLSLELSRWKGSFFANVQTLRLIRLFVRKTLISTRKTESFPYWILNLKQCSSSIWIKFRYFCNF